MLRKWIREALKRNPHSHEGTEWLQLKILEAKLALTKDPKWLESHTILGYDFGPEPRPAMPAELMDPGEQKRVGSALEYQLGERLTLVPGQMPWWRTC